MLEKERHGDILEIRMNRPPVNALGPELVQALVREITGAPTDGARAIVLSGQPGLFSAGLDVPGLLQLDEAEMLVFWKHFFGLVGAIACSPVPLATAFTGHCPAGGAVLGLFADYRVMAEGDFRIGLNEVQVGLPLPPIIHAGLVRQVGPRQAELLAAGGLMFGPARALEIGFIDAVAPLDAVVGNAVQWCEQRLALPLQAMNRTRDLARADLVDLFEGMGDADYRRMNDGWFSDETQANMKALVENLKKKKP